MATETPLPNSPESRTPDGTLKDQGVLTPTPTDSSTTPAETKAPDGQTPPKEPAPKQPTEGATALTDKGTPAPGAPEAYTDFTAPEGYEIDKEAIAKALPIFKEMNLNQEQAQKLVNYYAEISKDAAEAPINHYVNMQKEWREEAQSRFGKAIEPGGKIVTELAQAIDGFLPPSLARSFREVLDFTGVGNHPDFIEGFSLFAKALATGTHVSGKGPSPAGQKAPDAGPPSIAQAMYPHLPSASGQR